MLMKKGVITSLASEGRLTLQVPQYDIIIKEGRAFFAQSLTCAEGAKEHPDEWFVWLKNSRPAIGRESGFLFLTRKGWEANKEEIKKAFEASKTKRGTWKEFEDHAEYHLKEVEEKTQKHIRFLQKKIDVLNESLN